MAALPALNKVWVEGILHSVNFAFDQNTIIAPI